MPSGKLLVSLILNFFSYKMWEISTMQCEIRGPTIAYIWHPTQCQQVGGGLSVNGSYSCYFYDSNVAYIMVAAGPINH